RISPGNEGRHPKVFGSAAVLQGLALRGFYGAAGGNDKRLAGGHIPFASCCEAWIDIGCAFRDLAELDCGAASGSLGWSKGGEKRVGCRVEMRSAHGGHGPFQRPNSGADGLSLISSIF